MFITRRIDFSASHFCRISSLDDEQNRQIYGAAAHPHGHGHNYVLEVTVRGDPDPVTGMILDLKKLKEILEEEVVAPMDHRFLNYEVSPFDRIVPTAENVASEIWRRLETRLEGAARLERVRLFETPDLYVDVQREQDAGTRNLE